MTLVNPLRLPIPIDHIGYGVKELYATIELFKRLGFSPTREKELMARDPETGEFYPLGQLSAHVVFEKGYIELSAPTWKIKNNHLIPFVERCPGIHILAVATSDVEKQHQSCRKCYQDLAAVAQASRKIEYGKNRGKARFKWFPLPGDDFPEGIVCFVEHLTRDLVFQSEVLSHPNEVSALAGVTLFSRNPKETEDKYKPFIIDGHGISNVHENSYLRIISYGDMANNNYGLKTPDQDAIIGLDMETGSLTIVKDILLRNKIRFHERPDAGIIVPVLSINSFILFRERNG